MVGAGHHRADHLRHRQRLSRRIHVRPGHGAASLLDAVAITWRQGHEIVAVMTGLSGFVLPLLQLSVLLGAGPLSQGREPRGFHQAMRLLGLLRPWCMVPVFLLGVLVAVVKLAGMADVSPGIGLAGFGLLTVLLTILGRLSPHVIWRYAETAGVVPVHVPRAGPDSVLTGCHVCGQVQALPRDGDPEADHHCVRCHALVHYRKPDHRARSWALLLAAVVLHSRQRAAGDAGALGAGGARTRSWAGWLNSGPWAPGISRSSSSSPAWRCR